MTLKEEFQRLIEITDQLLGPTGCPWDKEQTLLTIRFSPVEEACELMEAIESEDNEHICEELGDLFFNAVFLARLAEKEQRCTMQEALAAISEKLIRRHPHVFGDVQLKCSESVKKQWEEIKKKEKGKEHRKSALDSIPSGLHVISRAQQVLKKIAKSGHPLSWPQGEAQSQDELADKLLALLIEAELKGHDIEHAVRKKLQLMETHFRTLEAEST
jgi:tetrapyrrole methylase family protein/MazG family protein